MSVKIRLSRIGTKNVPFFRVIAVDSRQKRDGAYLDAIGTYDPRTKKIVVFDETIYQSWVAKGAIVTDSVKKIYKLYKKTVVPLVGSEGVISSPATQKTKKTTKAKAASQDDKAQA